MAETIIQLRRDTEANYSAVATSWIPYDGEICLVDTSDGLKYKVGNGTNTFATLEYNVAYPEVISGYYLNNNFYSKSTYISTDLIAPIQNKIYIDKNTNVIYHYTGSTYTSINDNLPNASNVQKGIMYLYDTNGVATNGTMTQRSISQGITDVKFSVASDDEECLVLNKPW